MSKNQDKISLPAGTKVPDHMMIIPDGNRRWARARGLDTLMGHKAGFEVTFGLAKASRDMGVHTLSLWGFSTENWDRTEREINYLMKLYESLVDRHLKEAMKEGVRIIHFGRKDRLPASLIKKIANAEGKTKDNTKHILNICLDYGGRDDIARAVNKYVAAKESGQERREMDEKVMMEYLDTHDQPYPYVDLAIRTSGEQRTSGLLLWQAAYAEIYWELEHFPDFVPEKLKEAVMDYSRRRRRFGGNDEEEHLKFNPRVVADLDVKWRHALSLGENERFRDLVLRYVREHYGLSKELAKEAGVNMAKAVVYGRQENWEEAKKSLVGLYGVVKKTLNLAFEPEIVANFEIDLWRSKNASEQEMRELYAEKWRVSGLQASKTAHLAYLADAEVKKNNWDKAKWYTERVYKALKERVA